MKKIYVLIAFCITISPVLAQKQLKLNLETGKTYYLDQQTEQDIQQDMMGMKQDIRNEIRMLSSYEVKSKKNDLYQITTTFDEFYFKASHQYFNMEYDSKNPDLSDQMSRMFSVIIGQPFVLSINDYGEVQNMDGLGKIIDNMMAKISITDPEKVQIKEQIQKLLGPEQFKSSFEMISAMYPKKSVDIGESWSNQVKIKSSTLPMNLDNTLTYQDQNQEADVLKINSNITSNEAATNMINGMKTVYEFSGDQSGTYYLDKSSGWILQGETTMTIDGTLTIEKNEQLPQDMIIPMKIISKTIYDRVE